jgi:hypothetical protein
MLSPGTAPAAYMCACVCVEHQVMTGAGRSVHFTWPTYPEVTVLIMATEQVACAQKHGSFCTCQANIT